jgi:hypothetical protein
MLDTARHVLCYGACLSRERSLLSEIGDPDGCSRRWCGRPFLPVFPGLLDHVMGARVTRVKSLPRTSRESTTHWTNG